MIQVPLAPIKVASWNYKKPETDTARYLFPTEWIKFFTAVQTVAAGAPYVIGSVNLTNQTSPLSATVVAPMAAGRYRITTYIHATSVSSGSSFVRADMLWTSAGVSMIKQGTVVIGDDMSNYASDTVMVTVDEGSQVAYDVDYSSFGPTFTYTFSLALEAVP